MHHYNASMYSQSAIKKRGEKDSCVGNKQYG